MSGNLWPWLLLAAFVVVVGGWYWWSLRNIKASHEQGCPELESGDAWSPCTCPPPIVAAPVDEACASCGSGFDERCAASKRPCGHHCNHSWTHDVCDWCSKEWSA